MAGLYPSLNAKFRSEGICPICLMEMGATPKYSCENEHTVCHRCKPYYYSCPTCQLPLDTEIAPSDMNQYHMPPAIHRMPEPYPPYPPSSVASAPFIDHERHRWGPPRPAEDQVLFPCKYSHLGCYAKVPEHLRDLHESRCQFRPHLEDHHLPTDLAVDEGALENCKYHIVGCNVRLPEWRKLVHEDLCIYKDKLEEFDDVQQTFSSMRFDDGDPEEMVHCRFSRYGCMVKMPRRSKQKHEQKCNYSNYSRDEDDENVRFYVPEPVEDPDEHVPCRWSDYGCQVEPRRCRKRNHEEKCNYRKVPCRYRGYGCREMLELSKKHFHEQSCSYS